MKSDDTIYQATISLDDTVRAVTLSYFSAQSGTAELELIPTETAGVYEVRVGDEMFPVVLSSDGISEIHVDLRGYRYNVRVLADQHQRLLSILRASPALQSRVTKVTSPMPGLIKSVFVADGDVVAKGFTLFTLEAMKMENAIVAPVAGTIRQGKAQEGIAVEKGALLCAIEPLT